MARSGWSTSNFLRCASGIVTAYPLTIALWARAPSIGTAGRFITIGNSSSAVTLNNFVLSFTASGQVNAQAGDGTSANAQPTGVAVANTWFHGAGVFASATSRTPYFNGVAGSVNAVSRVPSGINRASIGVGDQSTVANPFTGDIAEVAIWNIALSAADLLALSKGVSPLLIHPEALVAYWPLIGNNSPENNLKSNANTMAVIGSLSKSIHPSIYLPKRKLII